MNSNKRFFAALNHYGDKSSVGFANTWEVFAFDSRQARDRFVAESGKTNISAKEIRRVEAVSFASNSLHKPRPFSSEFWGVRPLDSDLNNDIEGCLGTLKICHPKDHAERFYR